MTPKNEIPLGDSGRSIRIAKSRAEGESVFALLDRGRELGGFTLLHTSLERPLVFVAGPRLGQVTCIYDFDVGLRVLVIEGGADQRPGVADRELSKIVRASDFPARYANRAELEFAYGSVEAAGAKELRRWSVPTLRVGLFATYPTKATLLKRLKELAGSFRGDGSRLVEG
jgi:hypothetical protein